VLACAVAGVGCTIVEIRGSEGGVRIERHLGLAAIDLSPDHGPILAQLRSFGLASSSFGVQAGWASQSFSVLPASCHVVVWLKDAEALRELRDQLDAIHPVCVVAPERGGP
jgi:hypothetical protein